MLLKGYFLLQLDLFQFDFVFQPIVVFDPESEQIGHALLGLSSPTTPEVPTLKKRSPTMHVELLNVSFPVLIVANQTIRMYFPVKSYGKQRILLSIGFGWKILEIAQFAGIQNASSEKRILIWVPVE